MIIFLIVSGLALARDFEFGYFLNSWLETFIVVSSRDRAERIIEIRTWKLVLQPSAARRMLPFSLLIFLNWVRAVFLGVICFI